MREKRISISIDDLAPFSRDFFGSGDVVAYIGSGRIAADVTGAGVLAGPYTTPGSMVSTGHGWTNRKRFRKRPTCGTCD